MRPWEQTPLHPTPPWAVYWLMPQAPKWARVIINRLAAPCGGTCPARCGRTARGATAYVTLEPCNHQGRTGPCSQALIDAGVARVVYGMVDPNPLVSGQGLARLQAAGIEVIGPCLEAEAQQLNRGFIKRMRDGRPFVTCKLAMSLDGRTAMASGE